jgi:PKHD-type hydroxylase
VPTLEPCWKSYIVATAEPILTPKQCNELITIGGTEPKINATIGTTSKISKVDERHRKSIISWIPFSKAMPTYRIIERWMLNININHFGFDTVQLSEQGQYAEYSKGGFYGWHMDSYIEMSAMPTIRKISMTLLLNDPKDFEGGELEFFCRDPLDSKKNKFKLKQGYAMFFASFLLHRVIPITKGNRKSLVMWFGGSPLR